MEEQCWWNSVVEHWKSDGRTVLVEQCGGTLWWKSGTVLWNTGTVIVEQCGGTVWWNRDGRTVWWNSGTVCATVLWISGTVMVEQCWWNSETVMVEQ